MRKLKTVHFGKCNNMCERSSSEEKRLHGWQFRGTPHTVDFLWITK